MHPKKVHLFKFVATAKAKKILEYLNNHEKARYKDLSEVANSWTLNECLREFYAHGFITYTGKPKRKLYEITEKGRKVLECLHKIEGLVPGKKKEIFHLLRLKYVISILEFISEHGQTKYADMEKDFTIYSIRGKVGKLMKCGLVHLHIEKRERRRVWFEITEEGKLVLLMIEPKVTGSADLAPVGVSPALTKSAASISSSRSSFRSFRVSSSSSSSSTSGLASRLSSN